MNDKFTLLTAASYIFDSMFVLGASFLPAAFNMSGSILGFGMLFLVSTLTAGSIYLKLMSEKAIKDDKRLLVESDKAQEKKEKNSDLLELLTMFFSYVLAFALQKYFISLVSVVVRNFWPNLSNTMVFYPVLFLSSICFFAVGLIENRKVLGFFTYFNGLFMLSLALILMGLNIYLPNFAASVPKDLFQNKTDYLFSLSCFIMTFFVQLNLSELYSKLRDQSRKNTIRISILSALFGFLAYGSVGYFGYRLLGNSIGINDLMQVFLNNNSLLNKYIKAVWGSNKLDFYSLRCLTGYQGYLTIITILFGFPFTIAPIVRFLKEKTNFENSKFKMTQPMIITWIIIVSTLSNAVSNFSVNMLYKQLGVTCINAVSFLLPALIYLFNGEKKSLFKKIVATIILTSSIIFFSYLVFDLLEEFFYPNNKMQGIDLQTKVSDSIF